MFCHNREGLFSLPLDLNIGKQKSDCAASGIMAVEKPCAAKLAVNLWLSTAAEARTSRNRLLRGQPGGAEPTRHGWVSASHVRKIAPDIGPSVLPIQKKHTSRTGTSFAPHSVYRARPKQAFAGSWPPAKNRQTPRPATSRVLPQLRNNATFETKLGRSATAVPPIIHSSIPPPMHCRSPATDKTYNVKQLWGGRRC